MQDFGEINSFLFIQPFLPSIIPFVVHSPRSQYSTTLRGCLYGARKILAPGRSQKVEQLFTGFT